MKELYKSLAKFQQEVKAIHKGTSGFGYTYASLSEILSVINPILEKNNLGFSQPIQDSKIKTIIFHTETGDTIESEMSLINDVQLKGMNQFQVLGSQITYIRRYLLSSVLGLVTDIDNDAAGQKEDKDPKSSQTQNEDKKWLNKYDKQKNILPEYLKIVNSAKDKGKTIADLRNYYKISKPVENELINDLK